MATTHKSSHTQSPLWLRQPSWWLVVISGSLLVFFLIAIVRELVHGYTVRQQVARLEQQVASEEQRQTELKDLLDYLASPTFQERQARLNLGLKKGGERVVIVPTDPTAGPQAGQGNIQPAGSENTGPLAWWVYFFGPRESGNSGTASSST